MKRLVITLALLLTACAIAPPTRGMQADQQRIASVAVVGQANRASVLAALGKTHKVVFDSGYESWVYQVPRGGGRFAEYVILFDPAGLVARTRVREPQPSDKLPGT